MGRNKDRKPPEAKRPGYASTHTPMKEGMYVKGHHKSGKNIGKEGQIRYDKPE